MKELDFVYVEDWPVLHVKSRVKLKLLLLGRTYGAASAPSPQNAALYGLQFKRLLYPVLLRGTLYPLSSRRHIVIILIHTASSTSAVSTGLGAFAAIDRLELEVLDHGIRWGLVLLKTGWEDLLQKLQVLQLVLLGEFDVELDVKVAVVVVAE